MLDKKIEKIFFNILEEQLLVTFWCNIHSEQYNNMQKLITIFDDSWLTSGEYFLIRYLVELHIYSSLLSEKEISKSTCFNMTV